MFKSIVVPIDIGEDSSWTRAIPVAAGLARAGSSELHIVNVVPDFGMSIVGGFFSEGHEQKMMDKAKEELSEIVAHQSLQGITVSTHVLHGTIYKEVMKAADRLGADLIVVAAHRPELSDYLIGPNAARIVRHANQSVFVVRG